MPVVSEHIDITILFTITLRVGLLYSEDINSTIIIPKRNHGLSKELILKSFNSPFTQIP